MRKHIKCRSIKKQAGPNVEFGMFYILSFCALDNFSILCIAPHSLKHFVVLHFILLHFVLPPKKCVKRVMLAMTAKNVLFPSFMDVLKGVNLLLLLWVLSVKKNEKRFHEKWRGFFTDLFCLCLSIFLVHLETQVWRNWTMTPKKFTYFLVALWSIDLWSQLTTKRGYFAVAHAYSAPSAGHCALESGKTEMSRACSAALRACALTGNGAPKRGWEQIDHFTICWEALHFSPKNKITDFLRHFIDEMNKPLIFCSLLYWEWTHCV